jgi:hypothetical protein
MGSYASSELKECGLLSIEKAENPVVDVLDSKSVFRFNHY